MTPTPRRLQQFLHARASVVAVMVLALLATPATALADGAHDHAGHDAMPPAVVNPGAGAQPAAPAIGGGNAAAGGVGTPLPTVEKTAVDGGDSGAATTTTTTTTTDTPVVAPVSGGGGVDEPAPLPQVADAAGGGGAADVPAAAPAAPAGELPFTGPEDNILIIALAGMLVPIGVLLYCAARRGDLRRLHRHLSMPRFEWADR